MKKSAIILLVVLALFLTQCGKKKMDMIPKHLRPGSAENLMNEGFIALNTGMLPQAEQKFRSALKKKKDLVGALHGLGIVILNRADFDNAKRYFLKALQYESNLIDAHNYLGIIYTEKNNYSQAKEHLLIAANSDLYQTPENAYANLAMLEIRFNKLDKARRYIERGIRKNKQFPPLLNAYGIILEKEKRYTQAIFYYSSAIKILGKDNITYLLNLGRVYATIGQKEKALDLYERALSKSTIEAMKANIRQIIKKLTDK